MSQTVAFIARITNERLLGPGERARLRALKERGLDKNTPGFDLFTGLWWPLRERNRNAPRRDTSWLVVKLFSSFPIQHLPRGLKLQQILGLSEPREQQQRKRFLQRFDALLHSPLSSLEPHLFWALNVTRKAIEKKQVMGLDWAQLLDDLSVWDRGKKHKRKRDIRDLWAEQYLESTKKR